MKEVSDNWVQERMLPHLRDVQAYTPGMQPQGGGWIKLNTNELPYPPSPAVAPAISAELERLPLYPNPTSQPLRQAIAARHGLNETQVIIGNGSDDLLNLLMRGFGGAPNRSAQTLPSYSLYPVLAAVSHSTFHSIPFDESMRLPVDELCLSGANIVFLTSPNAPTGVGFENAQLREVAARFRGVFVIDEAYADFAQESAVELLRDHSNLVITRTFSKSYGLAGLRVGYALGCPELIAVLDKIRDSYNVNRLSQAGALAAFNDQEYYREIITRVCVTRERVFRALDEMGWKSYPSQANFLFSRPPAGKSAADAFQFLQEHKVLVRHFPSHPLTAPYLRISIGNEEQMNRLLEVITSWQNHA